MAAEKQLRAETEAATAGLTDAKRRKTEAAVKAADNFFHTRHTAANEISALVLMPDLTLTAEQAKAIDWNLPLVFRMPPEFMQNPSFLEAVDACRTAFADSGLKATTGKAMRSVSKDIGAPSPMC